MGTSKRQLKAMLRKNFLLKIRHPFITCAEIFLPTIVMLLLIAVRTRVDTQIHPAQPYIRKDTYVEIGKGISPNFQQLLELLLAKGEYLAFAPDTEETRMMINLISIKFPKLKLVSRTYKDELELETYLRSDHYGSCNRDKNCSNPKIKGAVVFHDQGPQVFDYSIRLNHTWAFSGFPDVKAIMDTNGPYLNDLALGVNVVPTMQYSFSGFLTLQQVLDTFIIFAAQQNETKTVSEAIEPPMSRTFDGSLSLKLPWTRFSPSNIRIAPFPTREYTDDEFQSIIKNVMGILYLLGFLYPISRLISYSVFEKEYKIREGLYMMGLKDGIFHLSWFITYASQFAISSVIITACTMGSLFKYSDKTVVFMYFFMFGLSAIMLAFVISTFFSRAKTAVAVGTLSFLGAFFPYYTISDEAVPIIFKVVASLLSPTAFALGSINFADYERAHVGLRWSNMWRASSGVNFLVCLLMMLLDTMLYCVIGLYLDKILPRENGVRHPWNFIFQKCFWRKKNILKPVSTLEVQSNDELFMENGTCFQNAAFEPVVEAMSLDMKQQELDGRCIQIRNLHKVYSTNKGNCCAVNSLQLTLYENQILALLGHNGAGKSTTISMLVGLLPPTSGDALVFGKNIITDMGEIRKGLGVCPQNDILYPELTDNFWEMGDSGPCGPCTEIHFDRVGNRDAASLVNNDDPTCLEIWNLVFIQFNRESDGSLKLLPSKHVDTGMGFERLVSVLQNKMSNYDTDVFMPIFDSIQQATGARPYLGKVGTDDVDKVDMAYRVVADHIRTLSFAIADGSCPGNDGREYVLRRILRRAVRYGSEVLKAQDGFFHGLVSAVVRLMGDVFPELRQHESKIRSIIAEEEASFCKTLLKGIERFKKAAEDVQGRILSGQDAFVLWDTYGFPLDLTQLMAEERGLSVDVDGFHNAMNDARERSRNAQNVQAGGTVVMDAYAISALQKKGVSATDDGFKFIWFQEHKSAIKAIYTGSEFVESAAAGIEVGIVLESTSFYAEQGGQIFDTGSLEGSFGSFRVCNVQIYGGFILHIGSLKGETGRFYEGDEVICKVDYDRRKLIAPNHTCTHMLNFALREVLGNHVDQKGSIVLPEKLRFDFSHGKPVDPEHLRRIESIVNDQIKAELDVYAKEVNLDEARKINGLRAVFGEVYPNPVRVVAIGQKVEDLIAAPENKDWLSISAELCGGTHISNTREAKAFALLSEEGIAKGIRRITAVTTDVAFKAMDLACSLEQEVNDAFNLEGSLLEKKVASLKFRVDSVPIPAAKKAVIKAKIAELLNQVKKAQKIIAEQNVCKAVKVATEMAEVAASDGKSFCISHVDVGLDASAVREAVLKVVQLKGMPVMVFSTDKTTNKAVVYAGVPENSYRCKLLEVSEWLTVALGPLKGRCGKGKGGIASGQGTEASRVNEAMDLASQFASMKLK